MPLAICAIFRDEAPYLAEWVTFHRLQGVEQFWLYDNLSTDDWQTALAPEIDAGIVHVTPWPHSAGQLSAYRDCLRRHRRDTRWLAFIDIDEFLFCPRGTPLPSVLRGYDLHPAVVANWRMFGTNGYSESPAGLVTENYLMRGADDHHDNRFVKSIVYPPRTRDFENSPHCLSHWGMAVGEDHRPHSSATRVPATADVLRINHYYAKSAAALRRKITRPSVADGRVRQTALVPAGDVRDETILQFVPALKEALAERRSPERVRNSRSPETAPPVAVLDQSEPARSH